ncbi:MAG: GNAT family N-acetyltransferase [Gammaproteobacteria bacterium]
MTTQPSAAFNLRAYQPQDLPALVALFQASVSQLTTQQYDTAQRQAWSPEVADIPAWQTRFAQLELLIAEDGCAIACFIGFSLDGHIDLLYCAPSHARQGVASALYAAAEQRLRAAGVRELFTEASLVAHAFFAAQGFSVQQAQTVTRGAVILPRMLMCKTLDLR